MAGRDAPTLPGGRGLDLAAPGLQHPRFADDVRRVAQARYERDLRPAVRRLVDADDLVQDVFRRILRRNRCPSAWDPAKGSWTHYVDVIAGNSIEDLLAPASRVARAELKAADPDREDDYEAPERDLDLAIDAAAETHEPLWQRALRCRAEQRAFRRRAAAWLTRRRQVEMFNAFVLAARPLMALIAPGAERQRRPPAEPAAQLGLFGSAETAGGVSQAVVISAASGQRA